MLLGQKELQDWIVKQKSDRSVLDRSGRIPTHHMSEVCWQLLDLLELFDLLWVQILLQLPRRLLVREAAPLDEVMGHLLQQDSTRCVSAPRPVSRLCREVALPTSPVSVSVVTATSSTLSTST